MGQGASKVASKAVEKVAKQATEAARSPARIMSAPSPDVAPVSRGSGRTTTANNPAAFLRGSGMAEDDVRDQAQEMYLRALHKVDDEKMSKGPPEMPDDLLKFIQDVGPAKQSVDKDFTSPRLLAQENESELIKVESARKPTRQRIKMPLMGDDETFTTTRNTNFSKLSAQEDNRRDFGLSYIQLFQLLSKKDDEIDSFHQSILAEGDVSVWSEDEKASQRKLLADARQASEIPILRKDNEGTFFGLYPKDVPGPEVMSIEPIPESKVKLVIQDLVDREQRAGDIVANKLERRRQLRKGNTEH